MTLTEMQGLFTNAALLVKIQAACVVAANVIRLEATETPNHAARVQWARQALTDPSAIAAIMLRCVLAQNAGITVAQAQAAADADLQTAVNNAINLFVI